MALTFSGGHYWHSNTVHQVNNDAGPVKVFDVPCKWGGAMGWRCNVVVNGEVGDECGEEKRGGVGGGGGGRGNRMVHESVSRWYDG